MMLTENDREMILKHIKKCGWRKVRWEGDTLKAMCSRSRTSLGDTIRFMGYFVPVSGTASEDYAHVWGRKDAK